MFSHNPQIFTNYLILFYCHFSGLLGSVGDSLGSLGKPIKMVESMGTKMIESGLEAGNKAISLTSSITDQATDTANKLADMTSGAIKDGAKAGTEMAQGWLELIIAQLRTLLSLFLK